MKTLQDYQANETLLHQLVPNFDSLPWQSREEIRRAFGKGDYRSHFRLRMLGIDVDCDNCSYCGTAGEQLLDDKFNEELINQ